MQSRLPWFPVLFCWRGSVIPAVLPRVWLCVGFGVIISALEQAGWAVSWPVLGSLVPSIVLGLLLVFRTNTAYERFWEGRKLWGSLVNTTRNLARQIWVTIEETDASDRAAKIAALRLLVAFAIAMKLHLRQEPLNSELEEKLTPEQFAKLRTMNHPPLEIAFWIADYLQHCHRQGQLNPYQLSAMIGLLDQTVNVLGGCERILKTPIPLAYTIHLKQLLMLYCLSLTFQVVGSLHWWTGGVVGLVSFAVFGIEEIGMDLISLSPSSCRWQNSPRSIDDPLRLGEQPTHI
jgi:putative membrane protein